MKTTHLHIYKSMAERAKRWKGYYWITADDFGAKLVVFRTNMFHPKGRFNDFDILCASNG